MTLAMRAADGSESINESCPRPLTNDEGAPLFNHGSLTLHQLMIYISAGCLVLTVLTTMFSNYSHLRRYTNPQQQRQILRIINLPIAYCLFNFLALTFTLDYIYIEPIGQIYEAFSVAALFFLVLEWVAPDGTDRDTYFDQLQLRSRFGGKALPGGSLSWFHQTWSSALQYPLSKTVFVIIQIITQYTGDYCQGSWSPRHAHLYLFIADILLIGGALAATIRFFRRLRSECDGMHKPRAKIFSFIGIVVFQIIQDIIFHLLNSKLFSPTKKATYNDINFGIASFMTCIEAIIFSVIFLWSYSSNEFREGVQADRMGATSQRASTWRAILDALNMSDIIAGTVFAFQLILMRLRGRYGRHARGRRQRTPTEEYMHLEPHN